MSELYYKKDAGWDWNQALPIGNGKLGAMVFGNKDHERFQLNEDSLWYGGPIDRINKDALPNLEKVRNLIFEGKIPEAEELILHAFSANPPSQRTYAPFGELFVKLKTKGECEDYYRKLDLDNAVHHVHRCFEGLDLSEECFVSAPENALIIHFSSKGNVPFSLVCDCGRMNFYDKAFHDENSVYYIGSQPGDLRFCGGMTAFCESGEIELTGQYISCNNVKGLTIAFTGATSYREPDPFAYVRERLNLIRNMTYASILVTHIKDYKQFFELVKLDLKNDPELDRLTTDERLARINENVKDNGLVKTYFDFGRYLLISCSRPGSLPANLQGIWCKDLDPPWGCKFTVNINTQMNYWPAEMFGLGSLHLPLFDHMKRMRENGRKTAKEMYGCRGIVCHHNTDLWGDTAPQDLWIPGTYWVMSIPWLCTHIWQHYCYTKDLDFLKDMYPVIKDSVLFFHDFLIEKDGKTIICPSVSPENTYILPDGTEGSICAGSTMDNEILRDHFTQFITAYELTGDDDPEFLEKTKKLLYGIPAIKVGKHGQIVEWLEDYDEKEPGHRHISQLYGLHPSHQINMETTPELAKAANATIERRLSFGGGHTGWSRAWIMNMFARLYNGKKCYENLIALFKHSTLDNLFDNHPPFQIDGNFGSIAAIGEMLLQAYADKIILLPALPEEFGDGSIEGLRVPGGAIINLTWKKGRLTEYSVVSNRDDFHADVKYGDKNFKLDMAKGECAHFEIYND